MSMPSSKRRKVILACVECRERKRKCDGERPVCGGCARRGSRPECIYTDETSKRGSTAYVESLRARIRELERACAESAQTNSVPLLSPPASEGAPGISQTSDQLANLGSQQLGRSRSPQRVSTNDDQIAAQSYSGASQNQVSANGHSMQHEIPANNHKSLSFSHVQRPGYPEAISVPYHASEDQEIFDDNDDNGDVHVGVDAMGTLSGSICRNRRRSSECHSNDYFGPSSAIGFTRQIRYSDPSNPGRSDHQHQQGFIQQRNEVVTPKSCSCDTCYLSPVGATLRSSEFSLPPRADADALVESYFDRVHSLYPFLHRPTFTERYRQLWEPERRLCSRSGHCSGLKPDDRLFYSLLNAVFALGSRFSPHFDVCERMSASGIYYERLIQLLQFPLLASGTLELVQTLLLASQYLQSTDMPGLCWNLVGLAIRTAQSIGLHLNPSDCTSQQIGTIFSTGHVDEEVRRRVWGGCVTLDRVLSMAYGRPMMIHPSSIRSFIDALPSMSLDDHNVVDPTDSAETPKVLSEIDFYVESLKLIHYLGDTLDSFYQEESNQAAKNERADSDENDDRRTSSMDSGQLQRLLNLDAKLVKWQKKVPRHLRIGGLEDLGQELESSILSTFRRQAQILRARFLHMRTFLLRPVLLVLYQHEQTPSPSARDDDSVESMVKLDTLIKVAKICVSAAMELIDLISTILCEGIEPSIVWWYGVFYLYTCATIIHTARLCPSIFKYDGEQHQYQSSRLKKSYDTCLQCLGRYSGEPARRCRSALQMLEQGSFKTNSFRNAVGDLPIFSNTSYLVRTTDHLDSRTMLSQHYKHKDPSSGNPGGLLPKNNHRSDTSIDLPSEPIDGPIIGREWADARVESENFDFQYLSGWLQNPDDLFWMTPMPFMNNYDDHWGHY